MKNHLKGHLTRGRVEQILRGAFGPGTHVTDVAVCHGGLFNTSYRVRLGDGRDVILRVAPPADRLLLGVERDLLRRETFFAEPLRAIGLPVPALLHADFSKKLIARNHTISEFMPGRNWFYRQKKLSESQNQALYSELGRIAKRIHSVANPDGWFGYPPPFRRHRAWSGFVREYAGLLERDLALHLYGTLPKHLLPTKLITRMKPVLDEIKVPRLVHGDLWQRNVLILPRGGGYRVSALLDNDRALWGDPWFEWVMFGLGLPPAYWKTYGRAPATRGHKLRTLLYRGCGALQASLEEAIHFRHRRGSLNLLEGSRRDLEELSRQLP